MTKKEKREFSDNEKNILVELGNKIKNKRNDFKLSQADLADKAGIDRSYISMIERGETNITYLKLCEIYNILGGKF